VEAAAHKCLVLELLVDLLVEMLLRQVNPHQQELRFLLLLHQTFRVMLAELLAVVLLLEILLVGEVQGLLEVME
jgi:hypothetical protein